jgi:membrane protein
MSDGKNTTSQSTSSAPDSRVIPGGGADNPADIPPKGWWQVAKRGWRESKADNVSVLAGGVAFFGFLALFPALIAALTLYGLIADPARASAQIQGLVSGLPSAAQSVITDQLTTVAQGGTTALTVGLVVALGAALWTASSGVSNLIKAINIAYDEQEGRGFVKLRALALALALAATVFVLVSLTLVAVVPALIDALGLGPFGRIVAQVVRWLLLVALLMVGLAVVYRIAPDRRAPPWRWVSPGAVAGTLLWIAGSAAFSLYVTFFGNYNKTYGALAGVIVLMLWLYLTSYIVLLGAEINAESERQTEEPKTARQT